MITHFSLFTGIGGIDLAAEWAGFKTVGQCEFADYPTKVLEKHWPEVPRWRDIRDVTKQSVEARGIHDITLISGGFPCQPFSVAGKRRGKDDDRYLWPEMCRIIDEIRPHWVLGENVPGIINMALDKVLTDLESLGYTCQAFNIPACAVDAPHRRARIFIVAWNARSGKCESQCQIEKISEQEAEPSGICADVANAAGQCGNREMYSRQRGDGFANGSSNVSDFYSDEQYGGRGFVQMGRGWSQGKTTENCYTGRTEWIPEPQLGRVANGIPHRVDRLKCLGNAVVPQQACLILKAIADIEGGEKVETMGA